MANGYYSVWYIVHSWTTATHTTYCTRRNYDQQWTFLSELYTIVYYLCGG